ncbi:MAG: TniQ family protein [Cyanobacteria bacterium P01_A01_bin.83]
MHNKKFEIYPFYTSSKPNIPARTRLYPLAPIGIRTAYSESLTSYIIRLAEAHSVKPGILLKHEIAPLIGKNSYLHSERYINTSSNEGGIDKIFANAAKSFNSQGQWTESLIKILESLTSIQHLSCLTFLNWKDYLPSKNLLKKHRAWCPYCFNEWKNSQFPIYEPLIWNVEAAKICSRHKLPLVTKCPKYGKQNKVLGWKSRVGYCSHCNYWLGNIEESDYKISTKELNLQIQIINNIGGLISYYSDDLSGIISTSSKLKAYSSYIQNVNKATLARHLQVSNTVFNRWYDGNNIPTLSNLLGICDSFNVSLIDFFTNKEIHLSNQVIHDIRKHKLSKGHSKRTTRKYSKEKIILTLQQALQEFPPPSTSEIIDRLNVPEEAVRFHAQSLYSLAGLRHREYKKIQKIETIKTLLEKILNSEEYPFPSFSEVSKRVGMSSTNLRKNFPQLSRLIAEKYLHDRSQEAEKRKNQLAQEIKSIAIQLYSEGEEPLGYKISKRMDKPLAIIQDVALDALQEIRKELGYEK